MRQAVITGGVVYHHELLQPGEILSGFEVIDLADLVRTNLNQYDLVMVLRSTDGEMLRARRHQFARYLDSGGFLIAFGELWADWFPGCAWEGECAEDVQEPVIVADHPLVNGYSSADLHWHPARERWCCHGHLRAPAGAEVLVTNSRGDAWTYIDRVSTNGVILASTNLDPDTHTYHRMSVPRRFFENLIDWARTEAGRTQERRERRQRKIAGLYSGVHFQRAFYADPEFGPDYAVLPVWELGAENLHDYAALWIPRESNQNELMRHRDKLRDYVESGGLIVSWEQANQPWLPVGSWSLRRVDLENIRLSDHPIVAHLSADQVRWHSHGAYDVEENAEVLIDDGQGGVMLFLDERSFDGAVLAGTIDPDCHAGFGTETTRPLLRAILAWLHERQSATVPA